MAECEFLLRRALDLIDGHQMSRLLSARLAHLIHDLGSERIAPACDRQPRAETDTLV